jgi:hypothetical protein
VAAGIIVQRRQLERVDGRQPGGIAVGAPPAGVVVTVARAGGRAARLAALEQPEKG